MSFLNLAQDFTLRWVPKSCWIEGNASCTTRLKAFTSESELFFIKQLVKVPSGAFCGQNGSNS